MIKYGYSIIGFILLSCFSAVVLAGSGSNVPEALCAKKYGQLTFDIKTIKEELGFTTKEQVWDMVDWDVVPKEEHEWLRGLIQRGMEWQGDMFGWYKDEIRKCVESKEYQE